MKQAGFIEIVIVVLAAILLIPFPYFQYEPEGGYEPHNCRPGQVCPKLGLKFTQPLWKTVASAPPFLKKTKDTGTVSDPTANWKIYTSQAYSYEIKYPAFLIPKEYNNDVYFDLVSFDGKDSAYVPFSVEVSPPSLEKSVENFRSRIEGHIQVALVEDKDATINGYPAKILVYAPNHRNDYTKTTHIIIDNEKLRYIISTNSESSDQIMSTFKFIK